MRVGEVVSRSLTAMIYAPSTVCGTQVNVFVGLESWTI